MLDGCGGRALSGARSRGGTGHERRQRPTHLHHSPQEKLDAFPRVFVPFCVIVNTLGHLMNDEGLPGAERLVEDVMGLWRLVRAAA